MCISTISSFAMKKKKGKKKSEEKTLNTEIGKIIAAKKNHRPFDR